MAVEKRTELKVRGLTPLEIDYLKAEPKRQKVKSLNSFLLQVLREKIELGKLNRVEANYLAHLENMKLTSSHVLFFTQKRTTLIVCQSQAKHSRGTHNNVA